MNAIVSFSEKLREWKMVTQKAPARGERVLLTGAFGGVGEWAIQELLQLGYEVTCFDVPTSANRKKAKKLGRRHAFSSVWGDLTDPQCVQSTMQSVRPNVVVHGAAIIPPLTIQRPELAYKVNVEGTRNLVAAAQDLGNQQSGAPRRFVLVSSYSILGPSNPHTDPAPWNSETPVNPQDDYGRQKLEAETIVQQCGLEWTIVRLCAVFPLASTSASADTFRFSFLLPYDRREQAIDVRDAALAIANATTADPAACRTFVVGGGEGWQGIGGDFANAMMQNLGIPPIDRNAYRQADPAIDTSWYYENWVDTRESERVLTYQRSSFPSFLADCRKAAGPARFALPLLGPFIRSWILKKSPFAGTGPTVDSRPFAEAARDHMTRPKG
ncbi:NAD(P)-dependent oxidoreductase [Novosphingobium sp. 1949]|uniref:NAD(P)-dependent oxidoreductase n=1 Tax=Novosphingobium organovorum TaxID=2930092 RepID=A0ABT0BDA7_9SPHN|nr:NAD(P)-dependent oxidoreductase [Novosphingobium organovorum]MCJ2182895.1 NAD(P)-dependent oxidoreductase [Novosphingobium organovorum]